jgi:hemerythrin-like domain-containing protein
VAGAVAAVARTVSRRPANDAISLLERDHRRLEGLLQRAGETTPRAVQGRSELLDTITSELRGHEMVEEQVFYPALREHPEAKDLVLEGFEEHHAVDVAVNELRELPPGAEQWAPKLKVLQEMIQHHIDEEEGEMFRAARAVFGRDELAALGRRMAEMKAQASTA